MTSKKSYVRIADINCERPEEITELAQRLAPCFEAEKWCWAPRRPPQPKRIEQGIMDLIRTVMFRPKAGSDAISGGLKVIRMARPGWVTVACHQDLHKHLADLAVAPEIQPDTDGYPGITPTKN